MIGFAITDAPLEDSLRECAACAEEFRRLAGLMRLKERRHRSLLLRLRLAVLRSVARIATRRLCGLLRSAHSRGLLAEVPLRTPPGWTAEELEILRRRFPDRPIVARRPS